MQLQESKEKVSKLMGTEAEEYESHFVENPFIRMRERALQKQHDSKQHLGAKHLLASSHLQGDADMLDYDDAAK